MAVAAADEPLMAFATAFPPTFEIALAATVPVPPLAFAIESPFGLSPVISQDCEHLRNY